jgi:glycosyltransferase involved in cell wall biosynthesis
MASSKDLSSSRKLKICLITGTFPPIRCGIGDYTAKLAAALAAVPETNIEVSVITSEQAASVEDKRVKLVALVPSWNWSGARHVIRYLLAERPDIVHFQYPTALYGRHPAITLLPGLVRLWALFKPGWKPTCVLTIHEYATFRALGKIRIWLMALACQMVFGVSPDTVRTFQPLRFLGKRLSHIPIGSNITTEVPPAYRQNPEEWRREHGVKIGCPVIAYFGFISPSKGLPTLIEAFSLLKKEAQLLLIAEPKAQDALYQSYFDNLNGLIKSKRLEQKIHWTGFATEEEVAAYLQSATIAVFPYTDGVSLRRGSLLAALANRVPVISTFPKNSIDSEGLVDSENIWLIPPENSAILNQVIEELSSNSNLHFRLAENGQKLARQFGWPEIAVKHVGLYYNM